MTISNSPEMRGGTTGGGEEPQNEQPEPSLEELISRVDNGRKRAFLETFPIFETTRDTAKALGFTDWAVLKWQQSDGVFLQAFSALKKFIDARRLDDYEQELKRRALEGTSKHSDILLMFALKALNPDVYRDKPTLTAQLTGDITVKLAVPSYDDVPVAIESKPAKQLTAGKHD